MLDSLSDAAPLNGFKVLEQRFKAPYQKGCHAEEGDLKLSAGDAQVAKPGVTLIDNSINRDGY